jgi:hypothetical protein
MRYEIFLVRVGEERNAHGISVGKAEGKREIRDDVTTDLREADIRLWSGLLHQDGVQWWALLNMVIDLRVSRNAENISMN